MTVSKINPQMSRNKALIIIAIIAVILLCAILIPDNGGAIKSISYYDEIEDETYTFSGDKDGYIELRPANKKYKPIRIDESDNFEVWGVAVWTIRCWR